MSWSSISDSMLVQSMLLPVMIDTIKLASTRSNRMISTGSTSTACAKLVSFSLKEADTNSCGSIETMFPARAYTTLLRPHRLSWNVRVFTSLDLANKLSVFCTVYLSCSSGTSESFFDGDRGGTEKVCVGHYASSIRACWVILGVAPLFALWSYFLKESTSRFNHIFYTFENPLCDERIAWVCGFFVGFPVELTFVGACVCGAVSAVDGFVKEFVFDNIFCRQGSSDKYIRSSTGNAKNDGQSQRHQNIFCCHGSFVDVLEKVFLKPDACLTLFPPLSVPSLQGFHEG